jgi:hypothetical protein
MYDVACGFDKVTMAWSSQDYISELFRFNKVDLPEEAFAMLRLPHTMGDSKRLFNDKDEDLASFVTDFHEGIEHATSDALERPELAAKECERLWCNYYLAIAEKYGADGLLCW